MSDLTRFRDWCRTMAGNPDVPADDATLWQQIAEEIDEYLDGPPVVEDLFGEYAEEPGEVPC